MDRIIDWTATETAAAIARKDVSVVEVTQAHVDRMAQVNPALNAVVEPAPEAALAQARAMDNDRPDELPALWGVPATIKINTDQAGTANSNGLPALKDNVVSEDAAVVANLRKGGVVILGRTSTPEFSLRWFTSNPIFGQTLNPWDRAITCGGSSGGASASVAAGVGCLGHGNDLGGSLRYPAYACGLSTLRPSLGRVPAFNPSQKAERGAAIQHMSVQGVIARSVTDIQASLPVLSQGDWRDPLWRQAPAADAAPKRVGVCADPFGDGVDGVVAAAVQAGADAAATAGYEVVEIELPDADEVARVWGVLLNGETEATMLPLIRGAGSAEVQKVIEAYAAHFGIPNRDEMIAAHAMRLDHMRRWAKLFQNIDALIMPVSAQAPFATDQDFAQPDTVPDIIRAQRALYMINVLGLPAAGVRTTDDRPVPLGVQIVGPQMGDAACLSVAAAIQRELGFDLSPIDPVHP